MGRAEQNLGGRTLVSMTGRSGVLATVTGELTCLVGPEADLGVSEYSAGQRAQNRLKPEIVSQKIGFSKKFIPRLEILTTNLYI